MPAPIISVENLSKRYLVGHQGERGGYHSYTALRDIIGREIRNAGRKALDVVRGRQVVQGDSVEEFWALRDVSFEVNEGEVLGIIGRNGAGKSTLLKILSRITEPTAGRVTLRGRVASLLEVGTGFHPELTGRENIYLNGAILGMTRAEIRKKFDEIVAFAEVDKFLDTPVKRYSSGMYVRLAFAVAAHLEPEILIVDEVLAVGDAEFQKKCLGKMEDVSRREGRTVLFVSHNMGAIRSLCMSALLLETGTTACYTNTVDVAIHAYISPSLDQLHGPCWTRSKPAPMFDEIRPDCFFLGDVHGNFLPNTTRNDDPKYVYLDVYIATDDPSLNFGYVLYDDRDTVIYQSYTTDVFDPTRKFLHTGANRIRTELPPHFLNESRYKVELIASFHGRHWILAPKQSPIYFFFQIQGGLSRSPFWYMKRDGIMAPVLKWEHS